MTEHSSQAQKKRWIDGKRRWLIILLAIAGGYAAFGPIGAIKPIAPLVVLPGEPTGLSVLGFPITNTIYGDFTRRPGAAHSGDRRFPIWEKR